MTFSRVKFCRKFFARLGAGVIFCVIAAGLARADVALGAGAGLGIYPSAGSFGVGSQISTSIMVSSSATAVNAAEGVLKFDPSMIEVISVSKTGSIFTLWTTEPTFSNQTGTISFGGGSQQGFLGTSGKILSVVFLAKKAGTTSVSFTSSSVLAADGAGTNILTAAIGGTYTLGGAQNVVITPVTPVTVVSEPQTIETTPLPNGPKPAAPQISSTTNPDQEKWYNNDTVSFEWAVPGDATGVAIGIDGKENSEPAKIYPASTKSKNIEDLGDGTWYFHVQVKNANGWSKTANYRVNIDTTAPDKPELSINNEGDDTEPSPKLVMKCHDGGSGVEKFEVLTWDGNIVTVQGKDNADTEYELPAGEPGNHIAVIRALDAAGNRSESSIDFDIAPLQSPTINAPGNNLREGKPLVISGTSSYPDAKVYLKIVSDSGITMLAQAGTGGDGQWGFTNDQGLCGGEYTVTAYVEDSRGAISFDSESVKIQISKTARLKLGIFEFNNNTNMISAILAVIFFLTTLICLFIIFFYRKRLRAKTKNLSKQVETGFETVQGALKKQIREMDGNPELSKNERTVRTSLSGVVDDTEKSIRKEVREIEKDLK